MATTKEKEIKFKHSNLIFCGTKNDSNGNGCYIFKTPNQRTFTIQKHNFWLGSYFRLVKNAGDFFVQNKITQDELEQAAVGYITLYGTANQKKHLKIYK